MSKVTPILEQHGAAKHRRHKAYWPSVEILTRILDMYKSTATILFMEFGRPRIGMKELSSVLGLSITYVNNVAASGGLPVKTYTEGGRRWADVRDVGEYLDAMRERAA